MSASGLPVKELLVIGLTGGIGSGKSVATSMFAEHGAGIIDTDQIAHSLTRAGGDAIKPIRDAFGDEFISEDGSIDRSRMRRLIFSDASAKLRLEQILHPLIHTEARARLAHMQNMPYVIIVVPLLPTSPAFLQMVKRILVVDCDVETQISRATKRDHVSAREVQDIISQQTPREERLRLADDVIHNESDLESMAEQVELLHKRYSRPD